MGLQRPGAVIFTCSAIVAAIALGFVQCASLGFLRAGAVAGSFPRHISPQLARSAALRVEALAPLGFIEVMLAQDDLAAGRLVQAERHIDRVPAGRDRDALRARLFELRGDEPAALMLYLAAGDVSAIERKIAQAERNGDFARARRLQRVLISRLDQDSTHRDALADAWFRMGQLDATSGYVDSAHRERHWSAALGDLERAIKLAPLTPKYLLNAGNQALLLGRVPLARRYFRNAIGVDPANASAYAGLGDAALKAGDAQAARRWYDRARQLDPRADGVRALGKKLAS